MSMADLEYLECPHGQTCPEGHGAASCLGEFSAAELNRSTKPAENGQGTYVPSLL